MNPRIDSLNVLRTVVAKLVKADTGDCPSCDTDQTDEFGQHVHKDDCQLVALLAQGEADVKRNRLLSLKALTNPRIDLVAYLRERALGLGVDGFCPDCRVNAARDEHTEDCGLDQLIAQVITDDSVDVETNRRAIDLAARLGYNLADLHTQQVVTILCTENTEGRICQSGKPALYENDEVPHLGLESLGAVLTIVRAAVNEETFDRLVEQLEVFARQLLMYLETVEVSDVAVEIIGGEALVEGILERSEDPELAAAQMENADAPADATIQGLARSLGYKIELGASADAVLTMLQSEVLENRLRGPHD